MIKIVHALRRCKGSNAKITVLRSHFNNEDWKRVLVAMYDSSINYGISAPNDNSFVDEDTDVDAMLEHVNWLSSRTVTGNAARFHALQGSQDFGEIYRLILGGSLRCGVSVTTINRAYPGLIPTFEVMLAKDVQVTKFPCIASTKYDGVRLLAFVDGEGGVALKLRSGKRIRIRSLNIAMRLQPAGVYDGELVHGDGLQEGRTKITGDVNRCLKGTSTDIEDYTFCIFDMLEHDEWTEQQCSRGYGERLNTMNKSLVQSASVRIADMYAVDDLWQVDMFYANRLDKGYEGVIVRYSADPYVWGRSDKLIKKKATNECMLECVDTTEGTGKYEGMIGALMCEGVVNGKEVHVKLGSGLTDHDREMDHSYYVGKDIDVLYNDITLADKAIYHSLFLPRFKRVAGLHDV